MTKKILLASSAVVALLGLALVVGAQGPRGREGFGGGPGGGGRGSAKCAPSCPQYQFTFTRTSVQPVLLSSGASTVSNTTTGTIAGDQYGSTYHDVTLSAVGPWASQSGPQEFISVRDLDPGVMMNYLVNVTKGTYEQFAIKQRTPPVNATPPPNRTGGGPGGTPPTPTKLSYSLADGSYTCTDAEKTTFSHGANSTTTRVYCPDLHLVLEEDRTDPRFGSSTYLLSHFTALTKFPFTPTGKLVEGGKFGHGGGPGGRMPPPQG